MRCQETIDIVGHLLLKLKFLILTVDEKHLFPKGGPSIVRPQIDSSVYLRHHWGISPYCTVLYDIAELRYVASVWLVF